MEWGNKKTWLAIGVGVLLTLVVLGGALLAIRRSRPPITPPEEITNQEIQALRDQITQQSIQMDVMKEEFVKGVNRIHATVRKEVSAMRPDDVAVGLNDELSRFRQLQVRPSRVGNNGTRVLD